MEIRDTFVKLSFFPTYQFAKADTTLAAIVKLVFDRVRYGRGLCFFVGFG